jgi:hypothetical protein
MIVHCLPNFGVDALRFTNNPKVAGDDATLVVVCRRCVACSVRIDATSTILQVASKSPPCGLVMGKSLRCLAVVVQDLVRPYNGR